MVFNHSARRSARRDPVEAAAVDFVRSFITQYTSPDPFNANAYADKVLALGTGNFAKIYSEKMNEIVMQVARAEPGAGPVQEIGIERWNADGSADVIAVANMTTKLPGRREDRDRQPLGGHRDQGRGPVEGQRPDSGDLSDERPSRDALVARSTATPRFERSTDVAASPAVLSRTSVVAQQEA